MSFTWNNELKAAVIKAYTDKEPTPENTIELVKEIADTMVEDGKHVTPNGVMRILSVAKVYVSKAPAGTTGGKEKKEPRVTKSDAIAAFDAILEANGVEVDTDITSKLTGKGAQWLTQVVGELVGASDED